MPKIRQGRVDKETLIQDVQARLDEDIALWKQIAMEKLKASPEGVFRQVIAQYDEHMVPNDRGPFARMRELEDKLNDNWVEEPDSEFDLVTAHHALMQEMESDIEKRTGIIDTSEYLDAVDAGRLAGKSEKTINRWYQEKKIIGIKTGTAKTDAVKYPAWQFSGGFVLKGLSEVLACFGNNTAPAIRFITRPLPELNGQKPLELLKSGRAVEVLEVIPSRNISTT